MNQEVIHLYMMPGMAASPRIFEHIKLPEDTFKIHWLEWQLPLPAEGLEAYAKRMVAHIKEDNIVLLGVSFGGVLVQEMSRFINAKKVIIVSSVKSKNELPRRIKMAKQTKAYKLIPTSLFTNIEALAKYAFGKSVNKRIEMYKTYLSVRDKKYLDWAIREMMNWQRTEILPDIIHIHGDNDSVFPIKSIRDCITIKGGTHIMILSKYKWFNENLPKLILE